MSITRRDIVRLTLVSLLALAAAFVALDRAGWALGLMEYDQMPLALWAGAGAGAIVMSSGLLVLRFLIDPVEAALNRISPN